MATRAMTASRQGRKRAPAGLRSLGISACGTDKLVRLVQRGFPFRWLARLQKRSGLNWETLTEWVSIPMRTLSRRQREGRLAPNESDRVLRVARLFDLTVNLFEGDVEAARQWLLAPQYALANQTPLDFSKSEIGSREVEDLIGRIEHGILA